MSRRRLGAKRRRGGGWLVKIICFGLIIIGVSWLGSTVYQLWQKVDTLPSVKGHDFITSPEDTSPVLVVAKQSAQAAELDSLFILAVDFDQRKVVALELPQNLSDGATTIGQYVESHYYKEMQIAIEGQLALPITGYIIQPRVSAQIGKSSLVDILSPNSAPSWWSTTAGLPMWLSSTSPVSTSLSEWQVLQLAWLMRDLELGQVDIAKVPATALRDVKGKTQLVPEAIDGEVQDLFITDEMRREAKSIVVKNATHIDGLAALASRFVANMGGEVIAIEPADSAQTSSSITAEKESALTRSINQFLGIPTTIEPQSGRERADVELIIGTDAMARLGK